MPSDFETWFEPLTRPGATYDRGSAAASLFCYPYSGLGVAMFAPWRKLLDANLHGYAVRLPARESRLREPARTEVLPLAEELADAIVEADLPGKIVQVGFSMGGLIAFEVARSLRRRGVETDLLVAAASWAPHGKWKRGRIHTLSDDRFLKQLDRRYGGVSWQVLQNEEMKQLMLPMLRGDMQMFEAYEYQPEPPLDCEILTLLGTDDRKVTAKHMAPWRDLGASHRHRSFEGGHFFAREKVEDVVETIQKRVRRLTT